MQAANINNSTSEIATESSQTTRLLDSFPEERFDRLTRLAARLTRAPISVINIIDGDRLFFKSQQGLPLGQIRQIPLKHSFSRILFETRRPFGVPNSLANPGLRNNIFVTELGIRAYLGVPLMTSQGQMLGALCALDTQVHDWAEEDITNLQDIAEIAMDEVALYRVISEKRQVEAVPSKVHEWLNLLAKEFQTGVWTWDITQEKIIFDELTRGIFEVETHIVPFQSFLGSVIKAERDDVARALTGLVDAEAGEKLHITCRIDGVATKARKHIEIKVQQACQEKNIYISGTVKQLPAR